MENIIIREYVRDEEVHGVAKMTELTRENLNKILEEHKHWVNKDCKNWEEMRADLSGANLHRANLYGANLRGADLHNADLSGAKNVPYIPMVCPEEGDFIGWKKAEDKIVKLRIPEDALRSSATTRKCRCSKAEVIAIYNLDGTEAGKRITLLI